MLGSQRFADKTNVTDAYPTKARYPKRGKKHMVNARRTRCGRYQETQAIARCRCRNLVHNCSCGHIQNLYSYSTTPEVLKITGETCFKFDTEFSGSDALAAALKRSLLPQPNCGMPTSTPNAEAFAKPTITPTRTTQMPDNDDHNK